MPLVCAAVEVKRSELSPASVAGCHVDSVAPLRAMMTTLGWKPRPVMLLHGSVLSLVEK